MSKMYKCPECNSNYVSTDVDPEIMCKWCKNESPAQKRIAELEKQLEEWKNHFSASKDETIELRGRAYDLQKQLDEANKVIGFYGDYYDGDINTLTDFLREDAEYSPGHILPHGKRAREYLSKFGVENG